jgi:hypothetical protein
MLEEKMNTFNSPLPFCTASIIFNPWENNVRKEVSKLRSVAEFKAFNGNTLLVFTNSFSVVPYVPVYDISRILYGSCFFSGYVPTSSVPYR